MIPLGILAASGITPLAAGGSYDLLQSEVLTGSAASVTFSGLSAYAANYQHLQIRVAARTSAAANLGIQYNADTSANYSQHFLEANGSSVFSGGGVNLTSGNGGVIVAEANIFSAVVIDILDPFEITKYITGRSFYGAATAGNKWMGIASHSWRNTAALTEIKLIVGAQTLQQYSRFSLYGVKKA